jgi:hypothetical protein
MRFEVEEERGFSRKRGKEKPFHYLRGKRGG